jgi:hypothetical protein
LPVEDSRAEARPMALQQSTHHTTLENASSAFLPMDAAQVTSNADVGYTPAAANSGISPMGVLLSKTPASEKRVFGLTASAAQMDASVEYVQTMRLDRGLTAFGADRLALEGLLKQGFELTVIMILLLPRYDSEVTYG